MTKQGKVELFLGRAKYVGLPKESLLAIDVKALRKHEGLVAKWQKKRDDVLGPFAIANLTKAGANMAELENAWKQYRAASTEFRKAFDNSPDILIRPLPRSVVYPSLCRDVIVRECQKRVCVDQPLPVSVDVGNYDVDGTFAWNRQYDRFTLTDSVYGSDYWNLSGHHRTSNTHYGVVSWRAGATLQVDGNITTAGVRFTSLGGANGAYVAGDDGPLAGSDCGYAWLNSALQVLSKRPGGGWIAHVPANQVSVQYQSRSNCSSRPGAGPAVLPPEHQVGLDDNYPQGTEFVWEIQLTYSIKGWGYNGFGSVSYSLEVQPYLNLQACTWVWPSAQ